MSEELPGADRQEESPGADRQEELRRLLASLNHGVEGDSVLGIVYVTIWRGGRVTRGFTQLADTKAAYLLGHVQRLALDLAERVK